MIVVSSTKNEISSITYDLYDFLLKIKTTKYNASIDNDNVSCLKYASCHNGKFLVLSINVTTTLENKTQNTTFFASELVNCCSVSVAECVEHTLLRKPA